VVPNDGGSRQVPGIGAIDGAPAPQASFHRLEDDGVVDAGDVKDRPSVEKNSPPRRQETGLRPKDEGGGVNTVDIGRGRLWL
jgi:hypothetical protein